MIASSSSDDHWNPLRFKQEQNKYFFSDIIWNRKYSFAWWDQTEKNNDETQIIFSVLILIDRHQICRNALCWIRTQSLWMIMWIPKTRSMSNSSWINVPEKSLVIFRIWILTLLEGDYWTETEQNSSAISEQEGRNITLWPSVNHSSPAIRLTNHTTQMGQTDSRAMSRTFSLGEPNLSPVKGLEIGGCWRGSQYWDVTEGFFKGIFGIWNQFVGHINHLKNKLLIRTPNKSDWQNRHEFWNIHTNFTSLYWIQGIPFRTHWKREFRFVGRSRYVKRINGRPCFLFLQK
jgi:hypothetical protein